VRRGGYDDTHVEAGEGVRNTLKGAALAAAIGGSIVARRMRSGTWPGGWIGAMRRAEQDETRWRFVTVLRKPDEVAPEGRLPEPLARLGDAIEVQIRPAPGDRGTEIGARLRQGEPSGAPGALAGLTGDDPRQDVRSALREAKQLLEAGEVLQADYPPSNEPSLRGAPVDLAVKRSGGEGRL
jgi:hypothetical protein